MNLDSNFLITIISALGGGALITGIVNRMISKPDRQWDQAQKIREELRTDLTRAQNEISHLRLDLQSSFTRTFDLERQAATFDAKFASLNDELEDCQEKHTAVSLQLQAIRIEFWRWTGRDGEPPTEKLS